jgi:AraC-like DNA-binding protein
LGTKAHGRILAWEGGSLWIFAAPPGEQYPRTAFHAHHVIQLTLALSGKVELDGDDGRVSGVAVAVAPDVRHAFRGTGRVAHVFIASDAPAGRAIAQGLFAKAPIARVPPALLGELPGRLQATFEDPAHSDDDLHALGRLLIAQLSGATVRTKRLDPRVAKLITALEERLDESPSLEEAAAIIGVSKGRARHLFVEETGLSLRTYVLWLRLGRAVELFASGASLTEAAHGAGFSDSAHLSRTFRRMFGIAAVSLQVSPPVTARTSQRASARG